MTRILRCAACAQLLPAVRELYSRLPETYHLQPWELEHVLFSLGYTDDLADEAVSVAAAGASYKVGDIAEA
jgi:hypothetical protein